MGRRRSIGEHPIPAMERQRRHRAGRTPEPERRDEEIAQLKARLAELEVGQKEGD
jgi:hypothetical protein